MHKFSHSLKIPPASFSPCSSLKLTFSSLATCSFSNCSKELYKMFVRSILIHSDPSIHDTLRSSTFSLNHSIFYWKLLLIIYSGCFSLIETGYVHLFCMIHLNLLFTPISTGTWNYKNKYFDCELDARYDFMVLFVQLRVFRGNLRLDIWLEIGFQIVLENFLIDLFYTSVIFFGACARGGSHRSGDFIILAGKKYNTIKFWTGVRFCINYDNRPIRSQR